MCYLWMSKQFPKRFFFVLAFMSINYANNMMFNMKTLTFSVTFGSWKYNVNKKDYDITTALGLSTTEINNRIQIGAWNRIGGPFPNTLTDDVYKAVYYSPCAQMIVNYTHEGTNIDMTFNKVATHSNCIIDFMSPQTSYILNGGTGHFFWSFGGTVRELCYDTPRPGAFTIDNIIAGSTLEITVKYV